jgi:hypothetical protein
LDTVGAALLVNVRLMGSFGPAYRNLNETGYCAQTVSRPRIRSKFMLTCVAAYLMQHALHRFTQTQYLRFEREAERKHEVVHGHIVDMAAGSEPHAAIASNMMTAVGAKVRGRCRPYVWLGYAGVHR